MYRCVGIIAVGVVSHVTRRLTARVHTHGRIAVAITISVPIPNRPNVTFVDLAIAVIIDSVAHLGRSWMHRCVGVIAIGIVADVTGRR